jgi:pimeloyl-ACP methyl ester carboxylesterase
MDNIATSQASSTNTAGFADKPAMAAIRLLFPLLSAITPNLAASLSLRIFLTPQKHRIPSWEKPYLGTAVCRKIQVAGKSVATYAWGEGNKKILLCHSWGGRGTQLANFINPLVSKGYTVIAFDAPAHGQSAGKQTDMMEYSASINEVIKLMGPFHGIIGHSFGAGNTLFSKRHYGFEVKKIALIGCFAHGSWVTDRFGELLNIPPKTIARMRRILEEKYDDRLQWNQLDLVEIAKSETAPILIAHDRDDKEIPYANALKFAESCSNKLEMISTDGLGHRRILRDPEVISRICEFICEA